MRVPEDDDWDRFMKMIDRAHPQKTDKWLKLLLQGTDTAAPRSNTIKQSTEPLLLFALLYSASSG